MLILRYGWSAGAVSAVKIPDLPVMRAHGSNPTRRLIRTNRSSMSGLAIMRKLRIVADAKLVAQSVPHETCSL